MMSPTGFYVKALTAMVMGSISSDNSMKSVAIVRFVFALMFDAGVAPEYKDLKSYQQTLCILIEVALPSACKRIFRSRGMESPYLRYPG